MSVDPCPGSNARRRASGRPPACWQRNREQHKDPLAGTAIDWSVSRKPLAAKPRIVFLPPRIPASSSFVRPSPPRVSAPLRESPPCSLCLCVYVFFARTRYRTAVATWSDRYREQQPSPTPSIGLFNFPLEKPGQIHIMYTCTAPETTP